MFDFLVHHWPKILPVAALLILLGAYFGVIIRNHLRRRAIRLATLEEERIEAMLSAGEISPTRAQIMLDSCRAALPDSGFSEDIRLRHVSTPVVVAVVIAVVMVLTSGVIVIFSPPGESQQADDALLDPSQYLSGYRFAPIDMGGDSNYVNSPRMTQYAAAGEGGGDTLDVAGLGLKARRAGRLWNEALRRREQGGNIHSEVLSKELNMLDARRELERAQQAIYSKRLDFGPYVIGPMPDTWDCFIGPVGITMLSRSGEERAFSGSVVELPHNYCDIAPEELIKDLDRRFAFNKNKENGTDSYLARILPDTPVPIISVALSSHYTPPQEIASQSDANTVISVNGYFILPPGGVPMLVIFTDFDRNPPHGDMVQKQQFFDSITLKLADGSSRSLSAIVAEPETISTP